MPDATSKLNISELDFNDIKTNIVAFLQSQSEFKNYNFQGSSMDVLLDILSYNTHYNAFYMNMLANEMFLETASLRSSVVSRARTMGYVPKSITAARAEVTVQIFPNDAPSSVIIPKHTIFTSELENTTYTFTNPTAKVVLPANNQYIATSMVLKQGIPLTHRYLVDTSNLRQKFTLPNANSDTGTLGVSIQISNTNTLVYPYTAASDITAVNAIANVYFMEEDRSGKFEITFGDGVLGRAVTDGNIVILESLVSSGSDANRCGVFNITEIGSYANIVLTTAAVATGGKTRENVTSIKYNAPRKYETQNRAVTKEDYKRILEANYTGADAIIVWGGEDNDPPIYGKVFVSIKPSTGLYLSTSEKSYIQNDILKPKAVASIATEVVEPYYTNIVVSSAIKYDPAITTKNAAALEALIQAQILSYSTAQLNIFNQKFRFSNLSTQIDITDTAIKSSLTNILIKSKMVTGSLNLGVASNYTIRFNNQVYHPSTTYEGALSSTLFVHPDAQNVNKAECYLVDVNGVLKIRRVEGNETFTVQDNVGTINYETGLIGLVGFAPASITGSIFEITCIPASSDIIPKNNQILIIEPTDVTLTMITDIEGTNIGSNTSISGTASGGVAGSGGTS